MLSSQRKKVRLQYKQSNVPNLLKLCAILLTDGALGEESSILEKATVSGEGIKQANTWHPNALIDGNFLSKTVYENEYIQQDGTCEFTIILDQSYTLVTAFILTRYGSDKENRKMLGQAKILAGDSEFAFDDGLTNCSAYFYDSGF